MGKLFDYEWPDKMPWYKKTETWTTKEGKTLKIKNMDDNHIFNCLKLIEKRVKTANILLNKQFKKADDLPIYKAFKKELKSRWGEWYNILYKEK